MNEVLKIHEKWYLLDIKTDVKQQEIKKKLGSCISEHTEHQIRGELLATPSQTKLEIQCKTGVYIRLNPGWHFIQCLLEQRVGGGSFLNFTYLLNFTNSLYVTKVRYFTTIPSLLTTSRDFCEAENRVIKV